MNRKAFFISFAAFLVSGAIFAAVGIRALATLREGRTAAISHGSESAVDQEYQKLPADSQAEWMEGFTLAERSGREVHWSDLEGKVRVVSFFFSSCPANCLRQNQKIGEIQRAYAGKNVVCVSITCDPDTDSPERLREYATKLQAPPDQWLFLTGRLIYIRRVASELFKVALDKQTHTERLIVCDKWGNIRSSFLWNQLDEVAGLRLLVDKLLNETEPLSKSER
jgi:cytochrome oxidase Cu insertion factor (SCO1/SenC/PrrC family)